MLQTLKILNLFIHMLTLVNYITPAIIKSVILQAKSSRFLSGVWPFIFSTNVYLIKGKQKSSNSNLITLAFAEKEFVHYFGNLFFSDNCEIKHLARTTYNNIPEIINRTGFDIIIVEASGALSSFLSQKGFLIMPMIDFTLKVSGSERLFARMSKRRRRNINIIKKKGFTYAITKDPEELYFFYNDFYLPHIIKRHGKSAKPASFFEMKQIYRKGGLLLVKSNGKYVAGILYKLLGDVVCACYLGILKGATQYSKEGAGQASLYFLVEWAKQNGFKEINYGPCNPFMNDGLFTYKKSWGMKAKSYGDLVYGLRVSRFNTSVVDFLSENPLVFSESTTLNCLIFRKAKRLTEEKLCMSSYYTRGLSKIVVGLYPAKDMPLPLLDFSEEISNQSDDEEVTPYLFKLWSDRGGIFYQKVYSSQ